MFCDVLISEP